MVHLSDLHLTARDQDQRSEAKLFGRLRGMNAAFRALCRSEVVLSSDLVLVTGDVTDRGDLASWRVFWNAIVDSGLAARTLVVPGNHDVCHLGAPRVESADAASQGRPRSRGEGARHGRAARALPWLHVAVPGRVAIIGIDSTNAGNRTAVTNAVGRLGFHPLEAFARLLRRPAVRACPAKLVILHHSPNLPERRRAAKQYGKIERSGYRDSGGRPPGSSAALRRGAGAGSSPTATCTSRIDAG